MYSMILEVNVLRPALDPGKVTDLIANKINIMTNTGMRSFENFSIPSRAPFKIIKEVSIMKMI